MTSESPPSKNMLAAVTAAMICGSLLLAGLASAADPESDGVESLSITDEHHVMLAPAKNITVYLTTPTAIILGWLQPDIYTIHDVTDPDDIAPGDDVVASKAKEHITYAAVNKTKSTFRKLHMLDRVLNGRDFLSAQTKRIFTWMSFEKEKEWTCKPFAFFENYTVAMSAETEDEVASPVRLSESDWATRRETLKVPDGQSQAPIVPFDEGCVMGYKLTWQEVGRDKLLKKEQSKTVEPLLRAAKITDLLPNTTYKVSVIAQFASDMEVTGHPEIYITTADAITPEGEDCKCDWHGTVDGQLVCNITGQDIEIGQPMCTCKPEYEGPFCESCKPGYYRTRSYFPCHKCPCDSAGTLQSTCRLVEGFLKCDACEVGYTGTLCHACQRGFYKVGRDRCIPCHCNGNTPANARSMCLPTTGQCLGCLYNTTGYHCDRCRQGYIGDPFSYKNCTKESDVPGHLRATTAAGDVTSSSSGPSPGVVITVILLLLIALAALGVLVFRRYRVWRDRRSPAFWTVGMSPGSNAVDINSVHNNGARFSGADDEDDEDDGLGGGHMEVDDVEFYGDKSGGKKGTNKYLRLREEA